MRRRGVQNLVERELDEREGNLARDRRPVAQVEGASRHDGRVGRIDDAIRRARADRSGGGGPRESAAAASVNVSGRRGPQPSRGRRTGCRVVVSSPPLRSDRRSFAVVLVARGAARRRGESTASVVRRASRRQAPTTDREAVRNRQSPSRRRVEGARRDDAPSPDLATPPTASAKVAYWPTCSAPR